MKNPKRLTKSIMVFLILIFGMLFINFWFKPLGSISLYQKMSNSNYNQFYELLDKDYQISFSENEYEKVKEALKDSADEINGYTIIKNPNNWVIVNKTPDGKNKITSIKIISGDKITQLEDILE